MQIDRRHFLGAGTVAGLGLAGVTAAVAASPPAPRAGRAPSEGADDNAFFENVVRQAPARRA